MFFSFSLTKTCEFRYFPLSSDTAAKFASKKKNSSGQDLQTMGNNQADVSLIGEELKG
jgi:hypothetical protein